MPKLNIEKKNNNNEENLKDNINEIKLVLDHLKVDVNKLKEEQKDDTEFRNKFATYISYNPKDKKRLTTLVKEVNLIKKQISLAKLSPLLTKMQEMEERIDNLEENNNESIE